MSSSGSVNATLSRKLSKVLEIRTERPDVLEALHDLGEFYGKNSITARRNLRGQMEKRSVEINNQFLDIFLSLQQQLDEVQGSVSQMKSCCSLMAEALKNTRETAGRIIQQTEHLDTQRKQNESFQHICSNFLLRFQLTENELNCLKAPEITEGFFQVLKRIQRIQEDCKMLLRTQQQSAGVEILDEMSLHSDAAYRRLYRWICSECRKFDSNLSLIEVPEMLKHAICALLAQPVLLSFSLEEIAGNRSKAVVRMFIVALTQGSPNEITRPIELHAHDSIRYVGDMLAWIHQTVANEAEFVHNLLEEITLDSTSNTSSSFHAPFNPLKLTDPLHGAKIVDQTKVLSNVIDGICSPFKVRFDQILMLKPNVITAYRLSNLLDFYTRTIGRLMGDQATLSLVLNECKQDSLKLFYDLLKDQGAKLQRNPPNPPSNLEPPHEVYESINRLEDIIVIFNSSLVPIEERETEFSSILSAVIDPLLQACTLSAIRLSLSDMAVYMINCISTIQSFLEPYDFAASRVEILSAHIKAHMDTLVQEQASIILINCGLTHKITMIQNKPPDEPLSKTPYMDPQSIAETMRSFERLLLDPGVMLMPQCDRLLIGKLRSYARSSVSQMIYESYLFLYNSIHNPENQYEEPASLFIYAPDQVKTMVDAL